MQTQNECVETDVIVIVVNKECDLGMKVENRRKHRKVIEKMRKEEKDEQKMANIKRRWTI